MTPRDLASAGLTLVSVLLRAEERAEQRDRQEIGGRRPMGVSP